MSQNTVFLSYRRDEAGKHFARSIKLALEQRRYEVFLDVDNLEAGKWAEQLRREVPTRAHFLLLLTPGALDRCEDPVDWVRQEFELAVQHGRNVVPVRVDGFPLDRVTIPAAMHGVLDFNAQTIYHDQFEASVDKLVQSYIPSGHKRIKGEGGEGAPQRISPSRLPRGAAELFGREDELAALDRAWSEGKLKVVSLVAWGGVGKTSLVAEWQARLAERGFDGADCFDWSFYSQGTREEGAASGEPFVNAALRFFGDEAMAASGASPWQKGERLAQLVAVRRALLVLDGLEPLQHPEGVSGGELKDPAVKTLLRGLALNNPGLCVVTTREKVADLASYRGKTVDERELAHLSTPAGVRLLASLGVHGGAKDLEKLVEDVEGHALTLNLLGSYLHRAHGGDVRRRDRVDFEKANARTHHGHAFRAMAAYERWLGEAGEPGQQQLAILRLLGLFDRAASYGCIEALRQPPAIEGLTEPLQGLAEDDWNEALTNLRAARLVDVALPDTASGGAWAQGATLDSHPLLREHFGRKLRQRHEASWKAAHSRLYEHLRDTTEHQPATLEGLQPLYQAVAHGCHAGRQQEACEAVYGDRILRGTGADGFYSTDKLGAFGADLGAVSCFFEERWSRPSPSLTEPARAWLLNEAATRLRALGRLREAVEPMRAGLELLVQQESWKQAAISANNLSELLETLGELAEAEETASRAVGYADRSEDAFLRIFTRTTLAHALAQRGRTEEAGALWVQAERLQQELQPKYPQLYSLRGFQYCEWLLRAAERRAWWGRGGEKLAEELLACGEVERRAGQALEWAKEYLGLLDVALDHLSLGRARLYRALLSGTDVAASSAEIAAAVEGLRAAGQLQFLPPGLLTRAHLRWHQGDLTGARADLDEAWDIASRGPMPLFQADVLLHRARLFRDLAALREARVLIEKHGYGRRLPELEDAEAASAAWPSA